VNRTLLAAGLALALLAPRAARGDVFSPGDLSRPHANLEGLSSCTRCHVAGQQLSQARCLECHVELQGRVAQGRGLHGRLPANERACETCHHEHQGRDAPLVEWGPGGERRFDHARTGFDLRGKHRNVACARCHDARLVADAGVRAMLEKQPGRKTYLGAPQACAACHFDEHRGQLGADCQRCHGESGWKPARGFDHARTAYPLTGRHVRVDCAKCHRAERDPSPRAAAPATTPPASATTFVRFKGLPSQRCTDCHKDPHQDRFGPDCASCHTTADWKKVSGTASQRAFHDRTRYPLRGAHAAVACAACHGPFPGQPVRYKNLAFARCADCHADAHVGQLAARAGPGKAQAAAAGSGDCDRCHGVDGWLPARFELEDHDRLPWKLEGAHRSVACARCHPADPLMPQRFPSAVRQSLERRKRPVRVSLARLDVARPSDCRTCHKDPHAGQLDARVKAEGCTACHVVDSFRTLRFDHARDSAFPLTGRHAQAACGSCHRPDAAGVVRWRPLPSACASCHADPHAGQLARGGSTDCARCHGTASWKEGVTFVHAPPFTPFTLDGKHRTVACAKCHPSGAAGGVRVVRYKPLPSRCQGCHADFHQGAFRGYVP
jgi:hypothetical protein